MRCAFASPRWAARRPDDAGHGCLGYLMFDEGARTPRGPSSRAPVPLTYPRACALGYFDLMAQCDVLMVTKKARSAPGLWLRCGPDMTVGQSRPFWGTISVETTPQPSLQVR
jgi:hypothetical protein